MDKLLKVIENMGKNRTNVRLNQAASRQISHRWPCRSDPLDVRDSISFFIVRCTDGFRSKKTAILSLVPMAAPTLLTGWKPWVSFETEWRPI